jgi:hypothetical protein
MQIPQIQMSDEVPTSSNMQLDSPVKRLALTSAAVPTNVALVTPDQMDIAAKERTAAIRVAFSGVKQRQKAVASAPADNGTVSLSAELQLNLQTSPQLVSTDAVQESTIRTPANKRTIVATTTAPVGPKRRRVVEVANVAMPTAASPPKNPPSKKCQGCVHNDLLELKVMEAAHVKHCLKRGMFLEMAICAGVCNSTIADINRAAPKTKLHFCDEAIKGFHACENDPAKMDLECGLVLCVPCYSKRDAQCALEQNNGDGQGKGRRTRRRGMNKQQMHNRFNCATLWHASLQFLQWGPKIAQNKRQENI